MSANRAIVRLWVVASVFWIGYWGWKYLHTCIPAPKGVLFCPLADGETLLRTNYFHILSFIFGPPAASLLGGLLCWWFILRFQRGLESP